MRNRNRGQALVEFALVSPLLFAILFGTMQFGYAFYTYDNLAKAVSDGARYGSMHTYFGLCGGTCTSDTAYTTAVQNVVVYGNPSPTSDGKPLVHNLASAGGCPCSKVSVTVAAVNNIPTSVSVAITGYTMSLPLGNITLTNKPSSMFPYIGRYAHP